MWLSYVNLCIFTWQVKVSVRVVFMKIGTIDTIHDRYSAEVMVESKWREPALDNLKLVSGSK